jgi:hypothetical protein
VVEAVNHLRVRLFEGESCVATTAGRAITGNGAKQRALLCDWI